MKVKINWKKAGEEISTNIIPILCAIITSGLMLFLYETINRIDFVVWFVFLFYIYLSAIHCPVSYFGFIRKEISWKTFYIVIVSIILGLIGLVFCKPIIIVIAYMIAGRVLGNSIKKWLNKKGGLRC